MTFIAQAYKILCVIDLRSVMLVVPVVDVKHTRFAAYLTFEFRLIFDVSGNYFPVRSVQEVTIFHRLNKCLYCAAIDAEAAEVIDHSSVTFSTLGIRIQVNPYELLGVFLPDLFIPYFPLFGFLLLDFILDLLAIRAESALSFPHSLKMFQKFGFGHLYREKRTALLTFDLHFPFKVSAILSFASAKHSHRDGGRIRGD